ncbi:hypothetical protein DH2020_025040 [Rehmannia glutinosa]|uniref:Uncharacterized protein n=1 Tax=Rehmannia glutinosa TaxID=99300 RepID=A0ABR0W3C8_REHGL
MGPVKHGSDPAEEDIVRRAIQEWQEYQAIADKKWRDRINKEGKGEARMEKEIQKEPVGHLYLMISAVTLKDMRTTGGGEGELKKGGKKKFITKEEEPEQYWQTAGEREGENPMKTPLPYIIIFGMSTPFVILAIAFANGWIKVPVR